MQNMIEEQEALKDFSDQQLIKEMQMPSGGIRPISVVSELNRRRRMRADQDRAEAANAPTVAEEVVMAAGMGDMSQMAQAMAPKTSMTENTGIAAMMPKQPTRMATGGVVKMQEAGSGLAAILKLLKSLDSDEDETSLYDSENAISLYDPEKHDPPSFSSFKEAMDYSNKIAAERNAALRDAYSVSKMAEGGVVKMQEAGSPTREVVLGGKRYITDGSGRVFEAARSGSMRRGREITDPEIVSAVLATGPSVASDVGGLGDVSTNLDTFNPIASQGITPVNTFGSNTDQLMNFMGGQALSEQMPTTDASTQKAVSEIAGVNPLINEAAATDRENSLSTFPVRTGQQNQPQDPFDRYLGQIAGIGSTNFKTATARNAELEDAELELDVANSSAFIEPGQFDTRPRDADGNLITKPKKPLPFNELPGAPTRNETLLQDLITQNQVLIPGANIPRQQTFLDNQPQDAEELLPTSSSSKGKKSNRDRDSSLATSVKNFIGNFVNPPTRKEKLAEGALKLQESSFDQPQTQQSDAPNILKNVNFAKPDTTFLDNQPQTKEDMIEEETAAVINSAANTLANDVGGDALGARGPEAAKAAQQGLDKRMWMRIAMYGLIASEGTAKARSDAAKTFLKMDAQDKALESKEKIAIGDRESRERTTNARVDATLESIEQRRQAAAAKNELSSLESIAEYLQGQMTGLMDPMGNVKPEDRDAYNKVKSSLDRVMRDIATAGGNTLASYGADNLYQDNVDLG